VRIDTLPAILDTLVAEWTILRCRLLINQEETKTSNWMCCDVLLLLLLLLLLCYHSICRPHRFPQPKDIFSPPELLMMMICLFMC
jgi:hypothetical protein